ncbi:MAG: hypothetical protein WBY44_33575 [Bryobacteraceae bacterium]|jgi:hypothetical protein
MFRDVRLGDDIDDFCVRCKRVMNHAVVSVMDGVAAKVRCRTCHNDHDFRHEQPPPPKVDSRKAALFNQVLKTVDPAAAGVPLDAELAEAEGETPEIEVLEVDALEVDDPEPEVQAMVASEAAPAKDAKPAPKSAAKGAKGKPKAKK